MPIRADVCTSTGDHRRRPARGAAATPDRRGRARCPTESMSNATQTSPGPLASRASGMDGGRPRRPPRSARSTARLHGDPCRAHELHALDRLHGPHQQRRRRPVGLGHDVQAVVHPVDKVHVGPARAARTSPRCERSDRTAHGTRGRRCRCTPRPRRSGRPGAPAPSSRTSRAPSSPARCLECRLRKQLSREAPGRRRPVQARVEGPDFLGEQPTEEQQEDRDRLGPHEVGGLRDVDRLVEVTQEVNSALLMPLPTGVWK